MGTSKKVRHIRCDSRKEAQKVFPYGSQQLLETLGKFRAVVQLKKEETEAEFIVISGKRWPLLGRKTAMQLRVLKLGPQVNAVDVHTSGKVSRMLQRHQY